MRPLFTSCLAVLLAAPVFAQPPGGGRGERGGGGGERGGERGGFGGGGMRGGGGADGSFNRLIQSYGGNGDTLDYSRVPPETRDFYNRFSPNDPMPTSGTISRAQYSETYSKRMEAMRANGFGGGGFGRGPGGGERGMNSERAMAEEARAKAEGVRMSGSMVIQAAPGQPTVIHGLQPQPGMNVVITGPGGAPPGGQPERQANEDEVQGLFRRYDNDKDGRISMEEAQRTDRLKYNFAYYDANKDGYIDLGEARTYMTDRANNRVPQPDNANGNGNGNNWQGGGGGGGGGWGGEGRGRENNTPMEEPKPVVYRYGNLPPGLPAWFTEIDFDKDGQIGLYEWREAKKPVSEYVSMDLNGDGLLTAEEYLRFKKLLISEEGKMSTGGGSNANGNNNGNGKGNRNGGVMGNWPGRGGNNGGDTPTKKEDRRNEKGEGKGGNPFRKP